MRAQPPQRVSRTDRSEILHGRSAKNRNAAQGKHVRVGRVGVDAAGGHAPVSGGACDPNHAIIVAASGARKVLHQPAHNLLQLRLRVPNLALQAGFIQISEHGVGHGVASDFEALRAEFFELQCRKVSRFPQPSCRDVESRTKAGMMQDGRGSQQVSLGAVIESDADVRAGIRRSVRSFRKSQGLANAQPSVSLGVQEIYLFPKLTLQQNIAFVAGLGTAKHSARNLQLVIHQVDDGGREHQRAPLIGGGVIGGPAIGSLGIGSKLNTIPTP